MTSSNENIFRVNGPLCGEFTGPGEFPIQRPVTRSFDVFFDLRLNKRLSKQWWGWWFETLAWSLWRQCNVDVFCLVPSWLYHEFSAVHDDVIKWKPFLCYWPLRGKFTGHRQIPLTKTNGAELWCFLLICAGINSWVNDRDAGDLRRHRAQYDVTVISHDVFTHMHHGCITLHTAALRASTPGAFISYISYTWLWWRWNMSGKLQIQSSL